MKKLLMALTLTLIAVQAFAIEIKGLVVDDNNKPIGYACVYLQSDPAVGTVTDDYGHFTFVVDYNKYYNDTLIVSFIGYKEAKNSIYNINGWMQKSGADAVLKFKLKAQEQFITEARISEKKGKSKNSEVVAILKQVQMKLQDDFPQIKRQYNVKVDSYMKNEERTMGVEQDIGIISEWPDTTGKNLIKVKFRPNVHKYNVDPEIQAYLDQVKADYAAKQAAKDSAALAEEKAKRSKGMSAEEMMSKAETEGLDSKDIKYAAGKAQDNDVVERHVNNLDSYDVVKGLGNVWPDYVLLGFKDYVKDEDNWTLNKLSEDEYLLRYYDKKRFIGIINANHEFILRINAKDYSVKSYYQHVTVHANIPFGYKLNKKELAMLNGFTGMDIKKFKLKKVDADVDHNAFFVRRNGKLNPTLKTYTANGMAYNRKGEDVKVNVAINMKVLQPL